MAIYRDSQGNIIDPGDPRVLSEVPARGEHYGAARWSEGPLFVEVKISDELPPGFALLGWTKFPYNVYILITAGVDLLWIHKRLNVAFWLRKV